MSVAKLTPFLVVWVVACVLEPSHVSSHSLHRRALPRAKELKLDPSEVMTFSGDNVTFTCSYPANVTFSWDFMAKVGPIRVVTGSNATGETPLFFSKATLGSVTRAMSGEVSCSLDNNQTSSAMAVLVVNGVRIGGTCQSSEDCTRESTCQEGLCACPKNYVLIRLTENGYEVCKKIIYSLYDPCEFNEQCFHLVDSKSVCASNSVCTCAPWAIDINGRCVSKSEISYTKNQEMYRVGLIAVTCVIILVVGTSLWITLRRSCREHNDQTQRRSSQPPVEDHQNAIILEGVDKPPSYDDIQNTTTAINSLPNFKDALTNSMTAKKLLRQESAPAGQLLTNAVNTNPNDNAKTGCVSKVFTPDI